jgi:uncharacterized RmlC-like cupin family protein
MVEVDELECRLIRPEEPYRGKQGLSYFAGISAEAVGAKGICMHVLTMPPGASAQAHRHDGHETAIYMISGEVETWYGDALEHHVRVGAGDMFYIPAGVPHLPVNLSADPAVAIIARTDPNEQESVVLLPELDVLINGRTAANATRSHHR